LILDVHKSLYKLGAIYESKKKSNNLNVKKSELMIEGADVFGGLREFKNWLNSPNIALGDKVPAQLTNTLEGIEKIRELLDALSFGNVV